jgi:putative transposase
MYSEEVRMMERDKDLQEIAELLEKQNESINIADLLESVPMARLEEHHFTKPEPIRCKWCGSTDIMKYGSRKGVQEYVCQRCGRKFTAKDAPYKKQTPTEQIGASLAMFYDGLSFADISRQLADTYNNPVAKSTVYRWVISYTLKAVEMLEQLELKVSDVWVVDETMVKVAGHNLWFWDVIDEDTRFLLASHLSKARTIPDVAIVMRRAWRRAGKTPKLIISDGMPAYPDGIERVFGAYSKHIQSKGFTEEINTNLIERFHGTLKDRVKVLRGFKTLDTADLLLEGFLVHYNFFRPHMTLQGKTPAEVAGIKLAYKNWTSLIAHLGRLHRE